MLLTIEIIYFKLNFATTTNGDEYAPKNNYEKNYNKSMTHLYYSDNSKVSCSSECLQWPGCNSGSDWWSQVFLAEGVDLELLWLQQMSSWIRATAWRSYPGCWTPGYPRRNAESGSGSCMHSCWNITGRTNRSHILQPTEISNKHTQYHNIIAEPTF